MTNRCLADSSGYFGEFNLTEKSERDLNSFYRDAGVIVIGHFVWTILSILLVFSLLGVADHSGKIIIQQLKSSPGTFASVADADVDGSSLGMAESLIAKDFWLIGITLAETALGGLDYNWLWSGLLFFLVRFVMLSHRMIRIFAG